MNWSSPHETAPIFINFLRFPSYALPTLSGLVVSIGGLTESTVFFFTFLAFLPLLFMS